MQSRALTRQKTASSSHGFTIIELLIVIVIIAILAAITLVAYNGIQQRATNASIVLAAEQTLKLTQAADITNGVSYPTTTSSCATQDNSCTQWNGTVSALLVIRV